MGARRAASEARALPVAAVAAIAAVLAVLAYLGALGNPFVYDDHNLVISNDSLRDPANWRYLLLRHRFRPLTNVSYALDYAVWGLDPRGYHLTSLVLHAVNAALLAGLAARLARDAGCERGASFAGLATAVLFAVHPVQVESVAYVSGRAEVLAATFSLLALATLRLGVAGRAALHGALAAVLVALALGCKEVAVVVPVVFLAWERRLVPGPEESRRRRLLLLHLPSLALVLALGAARLFLFFRVQDAAAVRAPWLNLLSQCEVVWRYLGLLVMPVGQSIVHQARAVTHPLDPRALLLGLLLAGALGLALARVRRAPLVAFGALWFGLFLAPSSSIAPLNELMSEHRLYLASAGFFLIVAALLERAWRRGGAARTIARAGLAAAALVLGLLTQVRHRVWSDPVRLWEEAVRRAPGVWAAQYALGDAYRDADDCGRAIPRYREAIRLVAAEPRAWVNLGECLFLAGQVEEARAALEQARERAQPSAQVHNNLGMLALQRRDAGAALAAYREALRLDPANLVARRGLAWLHENVLGEPAAALRLCREMAAIPGGRTPETDECIRRLETRVGPAAGR